MGILIGGHGSGHGHWVYDRVMRSRSCQYCSQASPHQTWPVHKINTLQSDMATTEVQLDHLQKSMDTKMSSFQTKLESSFAMTTNALESKMDSKFDKFALNFSALDFKIDSKFEKINSKFERIDSKFEQINSKFEQVDSKCAMIEKDIINMGVNLKKDIGKQLAEFKTDIVSRN